MKPAARNESRAVGLLFALVIMLGAANEALAQYKSAHIAFEFGYQYTSERLVSLENSAPFMGVRVGWKLTDRWWMTSRIGFGWRKLDARIANLTTFMLQLNPLDVRYYFLTNRFRPYLGATTALQAFVNGPANTEAPANWGPGAVGGFEARLSPDVFLGLQAEFVHMATEPQYATFGVNTQMSVYF